MVSVAMKILPQRLVRPGQRRLDASCYCRRADRVHDLLRGRIRAFEIIEPNRHGQNVLLAQGREKSGLDERNLPETRDTVEEGERIAAHAPEKIIDLIPSPGEEAAVAFGKGSETDPGMLRVRALA